jgi:hypothetical protein
VDHERTGVPISSFSSELERNWMATHVSCTRIRLKPGSVERVHEWARTLNERRAEAIATLRDEEVTIESVFLDRSPDGDYLVYYMRGKDLDRSTGMAATSPHPIDAYHQTFKRDTWDDRSELELLVDLEL